MTGNKKPQEVGEPQAASKSFSDGNFNQFLHRIKAAIYKLAPWLFFMGVMHG
ncbi:hypothetical protein [Methylomonas sp. HYX-M1]|uniref:hypothetical protein n=1 Tax=Methylomonas sp. HYX-M1 TaxID=3139307 RepID=UPI00345B8863